MIVIIFIFFIKCFFRKKLKRINARLIKSRSKDIYISLNLLLISLAFILFNFFRKKHLMKKIKIILSLRRYTTNNYLSRRSPTIFSAAMENRCSSFILSRFSMAAENIVGDLLQYSQ